MRAFKSLSTAMAKGFFRDKMALFFAIVFPLMFLVLFGGLLSNPGSSKPDIIQVGPVSVLDQAPAASKKVLEDSLDITKSTDATAALLKVRKGDADAVIEQQGKTIIVHYSQADQVKSAIVQGTFQAIVQSANIQASGQPPTFSLDTKQVEDDSLSTIQFVTPGLLGWAIAMGATFGAATNLVAWRKNGLLRRLRLAPISTSSVVLANFVVLPMAFLSGSFFPFDGAPTWLQAVSRVLPLKHLNDGMLDTMVRGDGPSSALVPIAILLGFAIVLSAISAKLFRWDSS